MSRPADGLLQAYPDDREMLTRVDEALAAFPAQVSCLGAAVRRRLDDSGIVGSSLDYPFGLPMARWLASRYPRHVDVVWADLDDDERLEDVLTLLLAKAEEDTFTEGGLGWRQRIRAARAHEQGHGVPHRRCAPRPAGVRWTSPAATP